MDLNPDREAQAALQRLGAGAAWRRGLAVGHRGVGGGGRQRLGQAPGWCHSSRARWWRWRGTRRRRYPGELDAVIDVAELMWLLERVSCKAHKVLFAAARTRCARGARTLRIDTSVIEPKGMPENTEKLEAQQQNLWRKAQILTVPRAERGTGQRDDQAGAWRRRRIWILMGYMLHVVVRDISNNNPAFVSTTRF